jgi:hypothetical protein
MSPSESGLPNAPEYLITRAQQALATDPRTLELGLDVSVRADQVFVTGMVATESRRAAITDVVRDVLPDWIVHNHAIVIPLDHAITEEHIE